MKFNKWTLGLAAVGVVSLASAVQAEEKSNPVMTALSSTSISGYVDTAAVWRWGNNFSQTGQGTGWVVPGTVNGNPTTAPGTYQNKADLFNLNVVGLTLEKPLDESEWAAGYKADMLFGPDANGWNSSINAGANNDIALKQAYVIMRAPVGNGLDIKMGVFDTIIGYESYEAYKNPHWSRSYGWEIEPTQHTGALLSYRINDTVAVSGGIANTAAARINAPPLRSTIPPFAVSETEKTYMGGVTLTAPESMGWAAGSTLSMGIINGLAGNPTDATWIYAGGTLNLPVEGLKLGASYDHRMTGDHGSVADGNYINATYAYAIGAYISYKATEKMLLTTRANYAKGTDMSWYNSPEVTGALAPGNTAGGMGDPNNELFGVTATIDYSLWENVITRLEWRWDHDLTGQHVGSSGAAPFGYDDRNNFFMALNVIYKF